jgi:hypothetical protein
MLTGDGADDDDDDDIDDNDNDDDNDAEEDEDEEAEEEEVEVEEKDDRGEYNPSSVAASIHLCNITQYTCQYMLCTCVYICLHVHT